MPMPSRIYITSSPTETHLNYLLKITQFILSNIKENWRNQNEIFYLFKSSQPSVSLLSTLAFQHMSSIRIILQVITVAWGEKNQHKMQ